MEELGDAFIAMPGGFGTLEELSEIVVGRILKYHAKPVILYNVAGFFSPLVEFFEKMIQENFAKPRVRMDYLVGTGCPIRDRAPEGAVGNHRDIAVGPHIIH